MEGKAHSSRMRLDEGAGALGQAEQVCDKVARERTFEECPIEEKIERLRHEVRMLREALDYMSAVAHQALQLSQYHVHAEGRVLVPAQGGANLARDLAIRGHDRLK